MLVDGQGILGSIDGDALQHAYTEARSVKCWLLWQNRKDYGCHQLNFDDYWKEQVFLRFLNLLVNGASGIAVGYGTNSLPPA